MEKVFVKARAKINLNLEVLNKRTDGYHNIKSVFQKINLYDEMYITKTHDNNFSLETNVEEINNNENIIYKAYKVLKEKFPNIDGVKVTLNKKIPMQAGMGGGSTDCASFILSINKLFNLQLTKNEIESIGKNLGADVVPCLYNKAILVEGIGDIITPIKTNFKYYLVIVKPEISCNTKEMYQKIDEDKHIQKDTTNQIIDALVHNNVKLFKDSLHNTFEDVVQEAGIQEIKSKLMENKAIASLMTGSGSCVYGIFENKKLAQKAYNHLKERFKTYICTSYNSKREALQ